MTENQALRWVLPLIGGCSAAFLWLLADVLPDLIVEKRWLLLMISTAVGVSSSLLVTVGPLRFQRAAIYAAGIGLVGGGLLFASSWRFLDVATTVDAFHPFAALFVFISLSTPFAIAIETAPQGWRDYEALFDSAWSIFVRSVTGFSFLGLFWLVVFLSDALLGLVGFDYIGELISHNFVWMVLSGIVLGLALAVLDELKTVVSTMRGLALQLLRLLLPLVAVVVALFIFLVPFQGLGEVFGSFSAAATMLAMAAGGASLITAAVEARDDDAARSRLMVTAARGLSLLLPVIVAIAAYAIWLRVAQYGWTPPRLGGAIAALVMVAYSFCYAVAVALGAGWKAHIRRANVYIALLAITLSVLWLSPVLNAERISANDHIARFLSGKNKVKDLELHKLGEDWGHPGRKALTALRKAEIPPESHALARALVAYDEGQSEWEIRQAGLAEENQIAQAKLMATIPVRPFGQEIPEEAFESLASYRVNDILSGCDRKIDEAHVGCVAIVMQTDRSKAQKTVVLLYLDSHGERAKYLALRKSSTNSDYNESRDNQEIGGRLLSPDGSGLIAAVQDGAFKIAPAKLNAIEINGVQLVPLR